MNENDSIAWHDRGRRITEAECKTILAERGDTIEKWLNRRGGNTNESICRGFFGECDIASRNG